MDVKLTKEPRNKSRIERTVWAVGTESDSRSSLVRLASKRGGPEMPGPSSGDPAWSHTAGV